MEKQGFRLFQPGLTICDHQGSQQSAKKYLELDLQGLFSYHICELRKPIFLFYQLSNFLKSTYMPHLLFIMSSLFCYSFILILMRSLEKQEIDMCVSDTSI